MYSDMLLPFVAHTFVTSNFIIILHHPLVSLFFSLSLPFSLCRLPPSLSLSLYLSLSLIYHGYTVQRLVGGTVCWVCHRLCCHCKHDQWTAISVHCLMEIRYCQKRSVAKKNKDWWVWICERYVAGLCCCCMIIKGQQYFGCKFLATCLSYTK